MLTVVVCQFNREKPDFRDVELEDAARRDSSLPAPSTNKRKGRRKKARKAKGRDLEVAINGINLEDEEVEEVESFEDDRECDIPKVIT